MCSVVLSHLSLIRFVDRLCNHPSIKWPTLEEFYILPELLKFDMYCVAITLNFIRFPSL